MQQNTYKKILKAKSNGRSYVLVKSPLALVRACLPPRSKTFAGTEGDDAEAIYRGTLITSLSSSLVCTIFEAHRPEMGRVHPTSLSGELALALARSSSAAMPNEAEPETKNIMCLNQKAPAMSEVESPILITIPANTEIVLLEAPD